MARQRQRPQTDRKRRSLRPNNYSLNWSQKLKMKDLSTRDLGAIDEFHYLEMREKNLSEESDEETPLNTKLWAQIDADRSS